MEPGAKDPTYLLVQFNNLDYLCLQYEHLLKGRHFVYVIPQILKPFGIIQPRQGVVT